MIDHRILCSLESYIDRTLGKQYLQQEKAIQRWLDRGHKLEDLVLEHYPYGFRRVEGPTTFRWTLSTNYRIRLKTIQEKCQDMRAEIIEMVTTA